MNLTANYFMESIPAVKEVLEVREVLEDFGVNTQIAEYYVDKRKGGIRRVIKISPSDNVSFQHKLGEILAEMERRAITGWQEYRNKPSSGYYYQRVGLKKYSSF